MWEIGPQNRQTKEYISQCVNCTIDSVNKFIVHLSLTDCPKAAYINNVVIKFNSSEIFALLNIARSNRFQTRRFMAKKFELLHTISISLTSITRLLAKFSLSYYVAKCKPLLSDKHKIARTTFARMNNKQPIEYWRTFMYTDECMSKCY